jgi:hypothetical protein
VVRIRPLDGRSISRFSFPSDPGTVGAAPPGSESAVKPLSDTLRCLVIGIPDAAFSDSLADQGQALSIRHDQIAVHLPFPTSLELVVVPLFCSDFDALEIIETLGSAGYRGQLRVMTPKLPNRQIVLRELRSHAVRQGITVEMMEQG